MGKIVNRKDLSDILGVTPQTLGNWLKEGLPVVQDNGTNAGKLYDCSEVIDWLVSRRAGSNGGGVNQKNQEVRLTKERADNLEIKNAILRREYAPISVVSAVLSKVGAQISATLDSLPLNMKRKIPSLTTTDLDIAKREVIKCQNAASQIDEALSRALDDVFKEAGLLQE